MKQQVADLAATSGGYKKFVYDKLGQMKEGDMTGVRQMLLRLLKSKQDSLLIVNIYKCLTACDAQVEKKRRDFLCLHIFVVHNFDAGLSG